jgi:hypothetical protein
VVIACVDIHMPFGDYAFVWVDTLAYTSHHHILLQPYMSWTSHAMVQKPSTSDAGTALWLHAELNP